MKNEHGNVRTPGTGRIGFSLKFSKPCGNLYEKPASLCEASALWGPTKIMWNRLALLQRMVWNIILHMLKWPVYNSIHSCFLDTRRLRWSKSPDFAPRKVPIFGGLGFHYGWISHHSQRWTISSAVAFAVPGLQISAPLLCRERDEHYRSHVRGWFVHGRFTHDIGRQFFVAINVKVFAKSFTWSLRWKILYSYLLCDFILQFLDTLGHFPTPLEIPETGTSSVSSGSSSWRAWALTMLLRERLRCLA